MDRLFFTVKTALSSHQQRWFSIYPESVAVSDLVILADSSLRNLSAVWALSVWVLSVVTECSPKEWDPLHFPDRSLNY